MLCRQRSTETNRYTSSWHHLAAQKKIGFGIGFGGGGHTHTTHTKGVAARNRAIKENRPNYWFYQRRSTTPPLYIYRHIYVWSHRFSLPCESRAKSKLTKLFWLKLNTTHTHTQHNRTQHPPIYHSFPIQVP